MATLFNHELMNLRYADELDPHDIINALTDEEWLDQHCIVLGPDCNEVGDVAEEEEEIGDFDYSFVLGEFTQEEAAHLAVGIEIINGVAHVMDCGLGFENEPLIITDNSVRTGKEATGLAVCMKFFDELLAQMQENEEARMQTLLDELPISVVIPGLQMASRLFEPPIHVNCVHCNSLREHKRHRRRKVHTHSMLLNIQNRVARQTKQQAAWVH